MLWESYLSLPCIWSPQMEHWKVDSKAVKITSFENHTNTCKKKKCTSVVKWIENKLIPCLAKTNTLIIEGNPGQQKVAFGCVSTTLGKEEQENPAAPSKIWTLPEYEMHFQMVQQISDSLPEVQLMKMCQATPSFHQTYWVEVVLLCCRFGKNESSPRGRIGMLPVLPVHWIVLIVWYSPVWQPSNELLTCPGSTPLMVNGAWMDLDVIQL